MLRITRILCQLLMSRAQEYSTPVFLIKVLTPKKMSAEYKPLLAHIGRYSAGISH